MSPLREFHSGELMEILPLIGRYLSNKQQDVRETAALALGLTQMPSALPILRELVTDSAAGRRRLGRSEVDDRTRAFAAYGIGILVGAGDATTGAKTAAYETLKDLLDDRRASQRDLKIAAINALGALQPDASKAGQKRLMWQTLQTLWAYYQQNLGKGEQYVQAHVPVAIGRLLGRGISPEHARYKKAFAAELTSGRRRNNVIYQSATIALGWLVDARHEPDKVYSKTLLNYYHRGRDQQSRYFALMAMAAIGGGENRTALLKALGHGKRSIEKPWAALALGVLTHRARKSDPHLDDATVGEAILAELVGSRNKSSRGAYAVALGLCGYRDAASKMRALVVKNHNHDELAGYLAIGLALMDDRKAIPILRDLVRDSVRRPNLLRQVAIALGKLRDKTATDLLLELIADNDPNTARLAAVATGLGYIGDRRTVGPLHRYLFDDGMTRLSRAFVAAALGSIADKEPVPFSSRYAAYGNYRASVGTLTNAAGTGILDLL